MCPPPRDELIIHWPWEVVSPVHTDTESMYRQLPHVVVAVVVVVVVVLVVVAIKASAELHTLVPTEANLKL